MKLQFLELRPEERRLYMEQAAVRRNVSPVILEKDFLLGARIEAIPGRRRPPCQGGALIGHVRICGSRGATAPAIQWKDRSQ